MKKGFSLLEMMVVLLLVSVIGTALFKTLSSGRMSWYVADTTVSLQDELRKAMRQITYDMGQSGSTQISLPATGATYNSTSFNISMGMLASGVNNWSSNPISYSLSSGQIIRVQGTDSRVVANNITNLSFARLASPSNMVRINVTVQKTTVDGRLLNASLNSSVSLRN